VGLGVKYSGSHRLTDQMFNAAARSLAHQVLDSDIECGRVYPALSRIRDVSANIAVSVAEVAYRSQLTVKPRPDDILQEVRAQMFEPDYPSQA
jgi:malate dehydrogenase (oxaloacetate-decarboxylating)(NADP+)